jgi:predicted Zn-dependent protease
MRNFNFSQSSFQTGALRGIDNWNNSAATIQFNRNSTSNNRVRVGTRNADNPSWLGRHSSRWHTGTRLRRWNIYLYSEAITSHANSRGYNITNVVENVMTHELGHVLGLADNPLSSNPNGSVMNSTRSRNRRDVPTNFDVQSMRMIYN